MPYIDLTDRFRSVFGILAESAHYGINLFNGKFELFTPSDSEFEDITFEFEGKKFEFVSTSLTDSQSQLKDIVSPPPIISFSKSKKLIESQLQDDENIVVERWNTGQWDIRMRGILVDMSKHHYPEKKIRLLNELFDYNGIVEVSGEQFHDKGIKSIYFKNVTFSGVPGYEDTIGYTLNAKSIKEVGFTLLNPN